MTHAKDWSVYMDSKWQEYEDIEAMVAARELERTQWIANITKGIKPPKIVLDEKQQRFVIREQLLEELRGEFFTDLISDDEYNERKIKIYRRYPI